MLTNKAAFRLFVIALFGGALLMALYTTLYININAQINEASKELAANSASLHIATEALLENQRFTEALVDYVSGSDRIDKDELVLRFDIYWSRLPLLRDSNESQQIREYFDAHTVVNNFIAALEKMEPELSTLQPGVTSSYENIYRELKSQHQLLKTIKTQFDYSSRLTGELSIQANRNIRDAVLSVLVISGTISIVLLIYFVSQYRKTANLSADLYKTTEELKLLSAEQELKIKERTHSLEESNNNLRNEVNNHKITSQRLHEYKYIVSQAQDVLILVGLKKELCFVNQAGEKLFGKTDEQLQHDNFEFTLNQVANCNDANIGITTALEGGHFNQQCELKAEHIDTRHIDISFSPYFGNSNSVQGCLIAIRDITEQHNARELLKHRAQYDALTELPNRFLILDRLDQMIHEAVRLDLQIALLFIDLNDFKKVNDSLGHEAGDLLLVETAKRFKDILREQDTVGRLGGDEFVVITGNLKHANDAQRVAKNIINCLKEPYELAQQNVTISSSIGIAIFPQDGKNASELLSKADSAMYHAKSAGGGNYSFFTTEMNAKFARRLAIEEQLLSALDNDEFSIYYQPKIDLQRGEMNGAEALIRWNNPKLGNVEPSEFIPIAEQTGHIHEIGLLVIKHSLRLLQSLSKTSRTHPLQIAINLSPTQLRQTRFVEDLKMQIDSHGVAPETLEFEITEGVLLNDQIRAKETLHRIASLGISIAMDDFGTGYSSLSYLRQYPFNTVKIDKSFIADIQHSRSTKELISASIALGKRLGLKVIAEGVENFEQLELLKILDCDTAQGRAISEPLNQTRFIAHLDSYRPTPAIKAALSQTIASEQPILLPKPPL